MTSRARVLQSDGTYGFKNTVEQDMALSRSVNERMYAPPPKVQNPTQVYQSTVRPSNTYASTQFANAGPGQQASTGGEEENPFASVFGNSLYSALFDYLQTDSVPGIDSQEMIASQDVGMPTNRNKINSFSW